MNVAFDFDIYCVKFVAKTQPLDRKLLHIWSKMSGELAPKHRLVICPKCWHLLPVSPDYDVYQCGGCGTTLQAKKRKSDSANSESSKHEKDAAPRNALDRVSKDKQYNNGEQLVIPEENKVREKAASSSSGECSLDGNGGRGQIENGECNGQQHGPLNLSDEQHEYEKDIYKLSDIRRHRASNKGCSNELTHCEVGASPELKGGNSVENANDRNLQLAGAEEPSNGNVSLEVAGKELICAMDEDDANSGKSALVGLKSEEDIIRSDLEGVEVLNNRNLFLEGAEEKLISRPDGEDANNDKSAIVGPNPEVDITGSDTAEAEELNNGNLLLKGAEEALNICASDGEDPNNDQSDLVVAQSDADITGNASTAKRSSTENFISEKGSISPVAPCKLEEGTSGNHVSSPNQEQKQGQKNIHHSFDCVRSVDAFDTTEVINPSSELSGTLGELSKSPTTRSSHDSSISSYDGVDERFPGPYLDSFENTCTVANGVSEGRLRKEKSLVSSMLYGDLETQHPSYLPNGTHHVVEDSRVNQNKVLETTRHGHRHWMRTKTDEFPSKMPFHLSGSQSGYESGSPSNQTHDELYCSSSFLSPDSCEDPDQEKMKLLKMIYKLQDQLNRTSYVNGETNGRLPMGVSYERKHISAYHSHDFYEGRFFHGLDYPRCNGRCSHRINWLQRHKFSRIPYLAEATSSTHHVDHSCLHCCAPQEWQCSAELPPHVLLQHEELCRSNPGRSCYSCHCSYPSSPKWFMASKQSLTKRHYRPVAGGAPFVTCHNCLKLLQLPADFLLFKRVFHELKCGACSEVLKFSLQNRSHIVSYAPNAIGPPSSSDLNDQNEAINGSNLHSASHANYFHSSHADQISYSDDYGLSVCKSYSSEGDQVSLKPFHPLHGSEYDNPSVPLGTFEPISEKEKIASKGSSASKTPVETDESAGPSSNVSGSDNLSSEMEARSPPKRSPLHQLMGYCSPSQVIRGIQPSVEGRELLLKGGNYES